MAVETDPDDPHYPGRPAKLSDIPRLFLPLAPFVALWAVLYFFLHHRGLGWISLAAPVALMGVVLLYVRICRVISRPHR